MAAINSITYLLYSILTLTANNKPTDPPLNALEIGSESEVTEKWNQEPYDVTRKYNEESCPAGETFSECDAGCQTTCENVGRPIICPRMCVPGCVCEEPGAVRGPDKKCIHPPLCPSADVDPDETSWAEQDRIIPTEQPDESRQYPLIGWAEQDPKISRGKCGANEKYLVCGSACPDNCTNLGKPRPCTMQCVPGCFCVKGYVRNDEGKCVPLKECPKSKCGANEVYRECGSACPANCTNLGKPRHCNLKCVRGCFCSKGHVRNDEGKCVPLKECPKIDPDETSWAEQDRIIPTVDPDETDWAEQDPIDNEKRCPVGEKWSVCDFLCQKTCEHVGKPVVCPLVCQSGCVCEESAVRGPDKKCINPSLCPSAYVDPDETSWAEQDRPIPTFNPDETDWAEQDRPIPTFNPDETDWAEQDRPIPTFNPDETDWSEQDPIDIRPYPPVNKHWSEQDQDFPHVDPDETAWAEQDPNIPRVDPDESVWAEQDPDFSAGKMNCHRHRSSQCTKYCKQHGNKRGRCTGPPGNRTCHCY